VRKKILAAMSGGVDSSVSAAVLIEKGFDVVGASMKLPNVDGDCCGDDGIDDARRVADCLGIPFYAVNCKRKFEKEVIKYFTGEYERGRTPNPCAVCNVRMKFGLLAEKARGLGIDLIATGHYARVTFDGKKNRYLLRRARDGNKDQSYFLFQLSQGQLKRAVFPLSDLTKSAVRRLAAKLKLKVHDKKESQEICFVRGDYRDFLKERKIVFSGGNIVDKDGKVKGRHRGIPFYTIGQRKGLGAYGKTVYVTGIDAKKNEVEIGSEKELFKKEIVVGGVNWIDRETLLRTEKFSVKIRSRHRASPAVVSPSGGDSVRVKFDEPQRAPSPGQAAVFYKGGAVAGGGWIEETRR